MSRFFLEDVVALKADPALLGIVVRSWRDFDEEVSDIYHWYFHRDVPGEVKSALFRDGRLSRGYVMVEFLNLPDRFCLAGEKSLRLVDRSLASGDLVKRKLSDTKSGTVISTSMRCKLQPCCTHSSFQHVVDLSKVGKRAKSRRCSGRCSLVREPNVAPETSASELKDYTDFREEDFIVFQDWIGQIMTIRTEITIRLGNGSVVTVDDPHELREPILYEGSFSAHLEEHIIHADYAWEDGRNGQSGSDQTKALTIPLFGSCHPGQIVQTKKANLRKGRWKFGAYNPNMQPYGIVVESRSVEMDIEWLCPNIFRQRASQPAPPSILTTDEIDSGHIRVYDRSQRPNECLSTQIANASYSPDTGFGNFVRFKDPEKACDLPRSQTQGFDMNIFQVIQTQTTVLVQWQDGSVTEDLARCLDIYDNPDENDIWPGHAVSFVPQETHEIRQGDDFMTTRKVGVVQSVNAEERMAQVRWYENPDITLIEEDPPTSSLGSALGKIGGATSDVSLYEIRDYRGLAPSRGNMVLLFPTAPLQSPYDMLNLRNLFPESRAQHSIGQYYAEESRSLPAEQLELGLHGGQLGTYEHVMSKAVVLKAKWYRENPGVNTQVAENAVQPTTTDCFGEVIDLCLDGNAIVRLGLASDIREVKVHPDYLAVIAEGDTDDASSVDGSEDWTDAESLEALEVEEHDVPPLEEYFETSDSRVEGEEDSDINEDNTGSKDDTDSNASLDEMVIDTTSIGKKPDLATNSSASGVSSLESGPNSPNRFDVLDSSPPKDHAFVSYETKLGTNTMRRLAKEHNILRSSLPEEVFVRTWDARLDLLRILIIGPVATPYEHSPFVIDFYFDANFPSSPPRTHFHSHGMRLNPNLYEDGMICLSLLGTWSSERSNETWSTKSTVLQILVSLLGLVLIREPYYNEAGYDVLVNSPDSVVPSALYSEKAYILSKNFVKAALEKPQSGFEGIIEWLYLNRNGPGLLQRIINDCERLVAKSSEGDNGSEEVSNAEKEDWASGKISAGAMIPLRSTLNWLINYRKSHACHDDDKLELSGL